MSAKTRRRALLLAISLSVMVVHWSITRQPIQAQLVSALIYEDDLSEGWSAFGTASHGLKASTPTHSGSHAISVTLGSRQFLCLQHGGFYTHGYMDLQVWIHGGGHGGQSPSVHALDPDGKPLSSVALADYVTVPADAWALVAIPLVDLGVDETLITGFCLQEENNKDEPTLYLDDISMAENAPPDAPQIDDWTVHPWAIPANGQTETVITAQVSDPQGDIEHVTLDLTALGGAAQAELYDDGLHNDGTAGDGVFGLIATATTTAAPGETPLLLTVTDETGNAASRYLGTFLVLTPLTTPWPASLPPYLGWGTGAFEWQSGTSLPWDYQGHYLTWFWQETNPNAVYDLAHSDWEQGYIPVITFDYLLAAASCGAMGLPECSFAHIQDPVIMAGYYDRLVVAAQQAAGSQPAIFHLEPDVAAQLQNYTQAYDGQDGIIADDPDSIPAWSGDPAYPNTYSGAVQRMVDLIHQEAPNVLVALHARLWAAGGGVAGGNDATLDVDAYAWKTAYFLGKAGGPQLDLIFVDWKTHDAGSGMAPWWDNANYTWPNLNRILYWGNRLAFHSGKPLVLWRLPVGNMDLDNTCQHYWDNRVDYAFVHPRDLVDAGVGAVVVNGGGECRTGPQTDGGNVEEKATVYYAQPAKPQGLVATTTLTPGQVWVSWSPNSEFDLGGYSVYCGRSAGALSPCQEAGPRTSVKLFLPTGGEWILSVKAYDARGIESPLASSVTISVDGPEARISLPFIVRGEP